MSRRQFGSIRKLPSGRYQASYWYEGEHFVAPDTFASRKDANSWLSTVESDIARRAWIDPRSGRVTVAEYTRKWLNQRYDLRPRTIELYEHLLRVHIVPGLGDVELGNLTTAVVR
jgi:hypothetical protein